MSLSTPKLLTERSDIPFIPYPELGVLRVSGPDAKRFLQGQLTCDLAQVSETIGVAGGHCDATGKLWSVFRLIQIQEDYLLLINKSLLGTTQEQFKKFGVFSKVTFTDESASWYAGWCVGVDAATRCRDLFSIGTLPISDTATGHHAVYHIEQGFVIGLHPNAYLVLSSAPFSMPKNSEHAAQAVEIDLGWPLLPVEQQQMHIPQALNLDKLKGISFKKGCYIGQETVARMHYKGQTKRRLTVLMGTCSALPTSDDVLEVQIGENWRRAGAVLAAVRYDREVVALQAVLPVDQEAGAKMRIKGQDDSQFTPLSNLDTMEAKNESNHQSR
ncbi:YgfZ/GcvT domain-containing protein [Aliidiomarina sanyensis]|uniref:CAF17-like 4Fe-4S cluster assembly/insertion protein YgfZ n=1 Tax=Aliidiomarina sanyensis TaxID=1249555 RepID=UPI00130085A6|nr:folate-binding protein [Aliidiomarina sanyensis]